MDILKLADELGREWFDNYGAQDQVVAGARRYIAGDTLDAGPTSDDGCPGWKAGWSAGWKLARQIIELDLEPVEDSRTSDLVAVSNVTGDHYVLRGKRFVKAAR
jgi:hypothetical protein